MVFKLAYTFTDPGSSQTGQPPIGSGAQIVADASQPPKLVPWNNSRPTKGFFSFLFPERGANAQRGMPSPLAVNQRRPPGSMPQKPPVFGGVYQHYTPYYDRGAAAYVPNFGRVLYNPIGAGIVALNRPRAYYAQPGQYANGAIWWTSQAIPTSINSQSLVTPQELSALLSGLQIEAVVRTTA